MAAFLIAGVVSSIYLSGGLFDSMGGLCYIHEWRCFFIAGVVSAIYLS